mgnify:CR=1 FL=1
MKNLIPIILLFLIACGTDKNSDSQNLKKESTKVLTYETFDNFIIDSTVIESIARFNISNEEKERITKTLRPEYEYLYQYEWSQPESPFVDLFIFLELNNDGKPDLIFQGESGGEPQCVRIHFSNKKGFDSSMVFMQYLKDLKIDNGHIKYLTVVDPGCCAEYVEQELTYEFDNNLNHNLVLQRARIGKLAEKYKILETPILFKVQNDRYKLRGDPIIDDTSTFIYDYPNSGNTLAIFSKGAKGKAWAIDKSDSLRDWWYVEMNPISDTLEFDMFNYHDDSQLKRFGWMSNKYVEEIK